MAARPGDSPADGELVFVSYSHRDAVWVQRFEVLLKPLLRKRRLRLWVDDAALRAGDTWRREIDEAIARSTAALLLVSGDFLASDFVMDVELPALERQGVRLLPVLVGDCLWDEEPALEERQWLHDPGHDGPLGRDAADPSRRDERMVAMCRKLVAALPTQPADGPAITTTTTAGPVAAVPEGTAAGELSDVPDAPPGYVVRDELAVLIDDVTAVDADAVGVTAAVGLLGQGGIGKSVLAAALGRDERIRRRFPDGIFWVTVGERADVLAVQLNLLARLGVAGTAPRTIGDATRRLQEVLAGRRVLLLVDDVWSDAAAHAFRVTGPQARVVYTTRDRQVVAAVGAREHPIDVLSPAAARAVAAAVLGTDPVTLPDAANRAFDEVDRVALAIALLAAAVRGGRSWDDVTGTLRREVDVYGDHPYANTFKAMHVAVAALPADLRVALLSLAVFPPDTTIPVTAVERYWAHTRPAADTAADLDRLAAANVLRRDGDSIGFHDLQHDYLLLHSPALPTLHADLLEAYRALLPEGAHGWWALPPDEPYVWDHVVAHLAGAGDRRALADTVTDPAFLARRISGSGLHAAEADLDRATEVLPEHRTIDWWRRWVARHAEFFAGSDEASAESATATMRAWLRGDPTRPAEVDPDRLLPLLTTPYLEVRWGLASPEPALERVLTGHSRYCRGVDWSPDGRSIISCSLDGSLRIWNAGTGRTVASLTGRSLGSQNVAWSPDGLHLATAGSDDVTIRDALGRTIGHTIACPDGVRALCWSPDNRLLAVAGTDGVHLWEAFEQRRLVQNLAGDRGHVTALAWSRNGRLAAAVRGGAVRIWDHPEDHAAADATREFGFVGALSWSPDGRTVAVGTTTAVKEWTPADGSTSVLAGRMPGVGAITYSPDGLHLAGGGRDRLVRVWNRLTGRSTVLKGHTHRVFDVAWAPDGTRLASAGDDGTIRIWDLSTSGIGSPRDRASDWIRRVAVSADGNRIATLGDDPFSNPYGKARSLLRIWDVATATAVIVDAKTGRGDSVTWTPDARHLLLAGRALGARRWELATGRTETAAAVGDGDTVAVAWAPDGTRHADARDDGTIRVHGRGARDPVISSFPHSDFTAFAWSADSTRLAAAHRHATTSDGGVVVWQADTGRIEATIELRGHPGLVLTWSPDGTRVAITGISQPLILWTPATGAITPLAAPAGDVAWSPDGTHIIASDDAGAVVVQRVDGTSRTRIQLAGANCVDWVGSTIVVGQRNGPAVLELREPGA